MEGELRKLLVKGRRSPRLDPALLEAVRRSGRGSNFSPPRRFPLETTLKAGDRSGEQRFAGGAQPKAKKAHRERPDGERKRPPYWASCEKMDFRELREFLDDTLREPPVQGEVPRSKRAFLGLLKMLARKGGVEWTREDGYPTTEAD